MHHSPSSTKKHSGNDHRAQSKASFGDLEKTSKDIDIYESHMEMMHSLEFPVLNPDDSLKNRITNVEHFCDIQSRNNQLVYEGLGDTKNILMNSERDLMDSIEQLKLKFQNELNTIRREYDHRFELQMAENKRLQSSFALLKGETVSTNKKLVLTIEKLQQLSAEFGLTGDAQDQDTFEALAMSVSRPNTANM